MQRVRLLIMLCLILSSATTTQSDRAEINAQAPHEITTAPRPPNDEALAKQVEEFLGAEMKMDNVPGLSIVVVRDGKVLLTGQARTSAARGGEIGGGE